MRNPRPVTEHRDEGQEIERKRQHPQERRGREIGSDEGGYRDAEARRNSRQQWPRGPLSPPRALFFRRGADERLSGCGEASSCANAKREHRESERPEERLRP